MKLIHRYIILFVLFYGLFNYCFGDRVRLNYCETEDCLSTAQDFDRLINWNVKQQQRCNNFYKFACGNGPPEKLVKYKRQDEYLKHLIDLFIQRENVDLFWPPNSLDPPDAYLLRNYYESCEDEATLRRVKLQPIINFINQIPLKKSWWELEKWAVSIGMNSTLFSTQIESHLDREDRKGAIIMGPPDTRVYARGYWDSSESLIAKFRAEGLNSNLANRLKTGMDQEFELFQIVQDPRLATLHHYGKRILTPISNWSNLWKKNRKNPSNIAQSDWENYFDSYWTTWMDSKGILPLLKNATFKQWIEYPLFVTTYGQQIEKFSEEDLKSIILWRMVNQLVEYADQETRTIMLLPSNRNCKTSTKNEILKKEYWSKVFPNSVKTIVKKIFTDVDLQLKLLNYKLINKVSSDLEPLNRKEWKTLNELRMHQSVVTTNILFLEWEKKNKTQYLTQLEKDASNWCMNIGRTFINCAEQDRRKEFAIKAIPNVKKRLERINEVLPAKRKEKTRCKDRLDNFEKKYGARMQKYSEAQTDTKQEALIKYVQERSYPKFPYENDFTVPILLFETLPKTPNYVDLALRLKRWERGMLLSQSGKFEPDERDTNFLLNIFPGDMFARFKRNRPASLNYGALGFVLGSRQMTELSDLESDRVENIETCLKKNSPKMRINDALTLKISTLSIKGLGLQAAWKARKRHAVVNGDKDERLLKDVHGATEKITKLNNDQLFFLSFANSQCAAINTADTLVNDIIKEIPKFYDAFKCNTSPMANLNKCLPKIPDNLL